MANASFTLSAIGDEIADKLDEQIQLLQELNVRYLDLRGVWGKNVLDLDDDEARKVRTACDEAGIGISSLGSPVGKSPIEEPMDVVLERLQRLFRIGEIVGTRNIRIFSFYPPQGTPESKLDDYVDEAAARLVQLADLAEQQGFHLLLENEKGIVGDTVERCRGLLAGVQNPALSFVWDPANFVQVGEAAVTESGWPLLGERTTSVHIKDAMLGDGSVRPAGQGDGQVSALLTRLRDEGYQGFLALEPHLTVAGHSSGFSGPEGMTVAVKALRGLMVELDCAEA